MFEVRKEALSLLEQQSQQGHLDLYYGDETKVSTQGYVPYGWQFSDERVAIEVTLGHSINCFGLLSRDNHLISALCKHTISAQFILEQLDALSLAIRKTTVVVLDNARVHTARKVKQLFQIWQTRGLYIFYLPPYSPQLNIIERFWKELKQAWIKPSDYASPDDLFYAINRIFAAVGAQLRINFSNFNL